MNDELVTQRVRIAKRDVVLLGAILAGEDHLASIHGESVATEERVTISILTTRSRAAELASWLDELAPDLQLEIDR